MYEIEQRRKDELISIGKLLWKESQKNEYYRRVPERTAYQISISDTRR